MKNLLFLDVETTGKDEEDRICQIAYKEQDGTAVCDVVKPPLPVKLVAMSINNITKKMTDQAFSFDESPHKSALLKMQDSHILVAHNTQFDARMLKKEGVEFTESICTFKLAHYLDKDCYLEKHNLSYLRYYFDLDIEAKAHDALGDILILEAVFTKLFHILRIEMQYPENDETVIQEMISISSKPTLFRKAPFGKYTGCLMTDIASDNVFDKKGRSWMKWLLGEKMKEEVKDEDWIYTLDYYLNAYEPVGK